MSGGSMNYFYSKLDMYTDVFNDPEMNDLLKDLVALFHDKEWADSGDTCDGTYNEALLKFKNKWFKSGARTKRLHGYIDDKVSELHALIDYTENKFCKRCKYFCNEDNDSRYGFCRYNEETRSYKYSIHPYELGCENWTE